MRFLLVLTALFALALSSGCIMVSAVKAQQGKAYVVKATPFGSSIWNCEASGGRPRCFKVIKQ